MNLRIEYNSRDRWWEVIDEDLPVGNQLVSLHLTKPQAEERVPRMEQEEDDDKEEEERFTLEPAKCCNRLLEVLRDDNLLSVMQTTPFSKIPTPPTLYLQSDGGHGGMESIQFCLFCGTKITFMWVVLVAL